MLAGSLTTPSQGLQIHIDPQEGERLLMYRPKLTGIASDLINAGMREQILVSRQVLGLGGEGPFENT